MKKTSDHSPWRAAAALLLSCCVILACLPGQVRAQAEGGSEESDDLETLYYKANDLVQEQNWGAALEVYEKIFAVHGGVGMENFGPGFGGIYFDYGVALMQTGQWEAARDAFKTCHEDYANPKPGEEKKSTIDSENRREKIALFQWGFCEHQLGNAEKALELYQRYLDAKPAQAELDSIRNAYYLRRGMAEVAAGKLEEGSASITKLFDNRNEWQVTPQFLMQGLLDLGMGWVEQAETNKDGVNQVAHAFLDQHGPALQVQPYDKLRFGFIERLKKLGFESFGSGLYALSLRFYSMVPTTEEIVNDLELRSVAYGNRVPEALTAALEAERAKMAQDDPPNVEMLGLMASSYERMGSLRAPRAIYDHLVAGYPKAEKRPISLHEAARFSTMLGDYSAAQYYGEIFMKEFPDHELRNNVASFMLQSLFSSGDYQQVIGICESVRERHEPGAQERELADHLYGISLYYVKRYDEAEDALDLFVKHYPKSDNLEPTRYFQASNQVILTKFRTGGELLDAFLADYPDSRYLDLALSDRAICYYNLEEYDKCVATVDKLAAARPDSRVLDRALNLKGDALSNSEDIEGAKAAYLAAASAAKTRENKETAAEGLARATDMATRLEQYEEAAGIYDTFFPDYAGTYWEPQISVFGMDALEKVDRAEDGLTQLEKMINMMGNQPPQEQDLQLLREAIGSYSAASVRNRGAEPTIQNLDSFPGLDPDNKALITWLKIQKVIVLQQLRGQAKPDSPERKAMQDRIAGVFEELRLFPKKDLSDYALQQIGLYLSGTENPFLAVPYFEELLNRDNDEFKAPAELEIGKIEARRPDEGAMRDARERFVRIIEKYKDVALIPEAYLELGRVSIKLKDWAKARDALAMINRNKKWLDKAERAESNYLYGLALENLGDIAGATKVYISTMAVYRAYPDWASKSFERGFELSYKDVKEREKKLEAYAFLRKTLFSYQNFDTPEMDRLRRRVAEVELDLNMTQEERVAIETKLGINEQAAQ